MSGTAIQIDDLDLLSVYSHEDSHIDDCCSDSTLPCRPTLQDLLDETAFEPGTIEYRKARKRRQNRESAARTRLVKKSEVEELRCKIDELLQANEELKRENKLLKTQNEKIRMKKGENEPVKRQKISTTASIAVTTLLVVCVIWSGTGGDELSEGRKMLGLAEKSAWDWKIWVCGLVTGFLLVTFGYKYYQSSREEHREKILV